MEAIRTPVENTPPLPKDVRDNLVVGWGALQTMLAEQITQAAARKGPARIAMEGSFGIEWTEIAERLRADFRKRGLKVELFDVERCRKSEQDLKGLLSRSLPAREPVFGRICDEELIALFDGSKLREMARRIASSRVPVVCVGAGSSLLPVRSRFHRLFFFDVTREEALKRNKQWSARASKTQSISPRRVYYVDLPLSERHRKKVMRRVDYYVDFNVVGMPKVLPRESLTALVDALVQTPVRVKPLYEPGVWGGQWLKRNRGLPKSMINCAYGFEIIAPEQSVKVACAGTTVELPFNLLMELASREIMGTSASRRFGDLMPIRFAYDDTWDGGFLSVQAHPTTRYMRSTFNEKWHQAEMYYIFESKPHSVVHLGLREGVGRDEFYRVARESERTRTPFDHREYVNVVPARKGEILLIPPGTIHGAGADNLVLEISSTPYRYTFKIYDYCRPDLDGRFRPIHIEHAFNVIKFFRKERWVAENLNPSPRLLRSAKSNGTVWKEYVIADRREFFHVVHRIEFTRSYEDGTRGKFHMINLVEGTSVVVRPKNNPDAGRRMALSETLLIPQSVGDYEVINEGPVPSKVVKGFLRV